MRQTSSTKMFWLKQLEFRKSKRDYRRDTITGDFAM